MAQALYRVHLPVHDKLGQPLHPWLPHAAMDWLQRSQPRLFEQMHVEGPHEHVYGPAHHLVTLAEDSPETDAYVKQLANHVGELTNHPTIMVNKHGEKGIEGWPVSNRNYVHGMGAMTEALAPPAPVQPAF